MSAPTTNIEKQKRRHTPALLGITGSLALVGIFAIALFGGVEETEKSEALSTVTEPQE